MSECIKSSGAVFDRLVFKLPTPKERQLGLIDKAMGLGAALLGSALFYALNLNKTVHSCRGSVAAFAITSIQIGLCSKFDKLVNLEARLMGGGEWKVAEPLSTRQRLQVHTRALFSGICFAAMFVAADQLIKLQTAGKLLTPGSLVLAAAFVWPGATWTAQWARDDGWVDA